MPLLGNCDEDDVDVAATAVLGVVFFFTSRKMPRRMWIGGVVEAVIMNYLGRWPVVLIPRVQQHGGDISASAFAFGGRSEEEASAN